MANVDEKSGPAAGLEGPGPEESRREQAIIASPEEGDTLVVESLGSEKYVFAAFFAAGIGIAFLIGRTLETIWNRLVEEAWVVRKAPQLLRFPEEERATYTMSFGAVVALIVIVTLLRKENVRRWADDVALELSKVTWPKKETVTNGTIVVIAAGVFATVYIGLLDRLWGFVTTLVYGA